MILRLLALVLILTATAQAQTKRAFIVGVADYSDASNTSGIRDLTRTINDARAYRARFEALGWTVTPLENPTKAEFDRAFGTFVDSIGPGDEVAFIFSGHGWSYQAENYLTFTDTPFENTGFTTRNLSVPLKTGVLFPLQRANRPRDRRPRIVVAFIDACRERPFDPGTMTMDARMGLRPVQPPEGMMLIYSAREGEFAYDRLGDDDPSPNSLFSRNMLAALEKADRPLFEIAFDVRDAVKAEAERAGKRQTPAVYAETSRAYCVARSCRADQGSTSDESSLGATKDFVPFDLSRVPDDIAEVAREARALARRVEENSKVAEQIVERATLASEAAQQLPPGQYSGGMGRFKAGNGNLYSGEVVTISNSTSATGFGMSESGGIGFEGNRRFCRFDSNGRCQGLGKFEFGRNENNQSELDFALTWFEDGTPSGETYIRFFDTDGNGSYGEMWKVWETSRTGSITPGTSNRLLKKSGVAHGFCF